MTATNEGGLCTDSDQWQCRWCVTAQTGG